MNIEHLIGDMVLGSLGGRRKRSRKAASFLRGGRGSFINASTLLTLGGLAWGVIETMQQKGAGPAAEGPQPPGPGPVPPPAAGPPGGMPAASPQAPPPLPGAAATAAAVPQEDAPEVPEGAVRIVRLMLSAARADGTLTDAERDTILAQAKAAGVEQVVTRELSQPTPLAAIVQGITDPKQREDLYVLAFSIVRADESVTGAERIYLAQLAAQLGLNAVTTARLEDETAARIEEATEDPGVEA